MCTTIILAFGALPVSGQDLVVGSKKFTENVILGDIVRRAGESVGIEITHESELGGTQILWNALLRGDIDIYPEYSGTLYQEIFADADVTPGNVEQKLADLGIGITHPLGFNNTYILGVSQDVAARNQLTNISDLRNRPELRFGFSEEFMARADGWPALQQTYQLDPEIVRGLDHDIAYRGLAEGAIDVIDLYSTDAEIQYYNIFTLTDDLNFFPRYDAVYLYRLDLLSRAPAFLNVLKTIEGSISESEMIQMNASAKLDKISPSQIASDFLVALGIDSISEVVPESITQRVLRNTRDHLYMVIISLLAAILIAIPLGVFATINRLAGRIILGIVGALYTIPALALLVFMIPFLGIGAVPAMVALFLYSLLPIVRNTFSGIQSIDPNLTEAAVAMGLSTWTQLTKIKLPLASRSILSGIKTAAVINIGTATLGALIGAGGLGQPILTGIRLDDTSLILEGAIPAAVLAFLAQALFDFSERWFVPKGLRLTTID